MSASSVVGGWWDNSRQTWTFPYAPNTIPDPTFRRPIQQPVLIPGNTYIFPQPTFAGQTSSMPTALTGVWIAYGESTIYVFREEVEALRVALADGLRVQFVEFGGELQR